MIEQKWDKIGEVVDGPEESNRPFLDGIQCDYVFDVDIGDGMPFCKLPYNRSGHALYLFLLGRKGCLFLMQLSLIGSLKRLLSSTMLYYLTRKASKKKGLKISKEEHELIC